METGTVHRVNGQSPLQCRDSFIINAAAAAAAVNEALASDRLALFIACCTIRTLSLPCAYFRFAFTSGINSSIVIELAAASAAQERLRLQVGQLVEEEMTVK